MSPNESAALFGQQGARTARLMLYILISIVLMAMDQRGQYVPKVRQFLGQITEPLYHIVEWPFVAIRALSNEAHSRDELNTRINTLEEDLLRQEGSLQQLAALREENARLRALLEASEQAEFSYLYADMVLVDLDPFSHRVLIERGRTHGVVAGQPVIDGQGIVGQVESVARGVSWVRLISDPNHALPVQINRTGLRTVAYGSGETSRLSLPNIPLHADVREGDLLVTSGLGERFPPGYPVARVVQVDRESGQTFTRVDAMPLALLDRGRSVLLVQGWQQRDFDQVFSEDQETLVEETPLDAQQDEAAVDLADQPSEAEQ